MRRHAPLAARRHRAVEEKDPNPVAATANPTQTRSGRRPAMIAPTAIKISEVRELTGWASHPLPIRSQSTSAPISANGNDIAWVKGEVPGGADISIGFSLIGTPPATDHG